MNPIQKHKQWGDHKPLFEAGRFTYPYIREYQKAYLNEGVRDTFDYFCSQLPEKLYILDKTERRLNI